MNDRSRRSGYSESRIDRAAHLRCDTGWLQDALRRARFILFCGNRILFPVGERGAGVPLFGADAAEALAASLERAVFLGLDEDVPVFAAPVEEPAEGHAAIDLRSVATQGLVDTDLLGVLAQGKSLIDWHGRHGYCAVCGAATNLADGGYRRACASCGASHFPRTDPVAIMLVVDGDDCLLARSPRFQPKVYSALAGFVEPGETIEDAVRREVMEEVGVRVGRVIYHSSQPWPFPSSLMIGCLAQAASRDIVIDRIEIEAARWFNRTEAGEMLKGQHPDGLSTPPPMAIAHQLVKSWIVGETSP